MSFFDSNGKTRREVEFTFSGGQKAKVVIDTISWEDGSGESWLFEGCMTALNQIKVPSHQEVYGYFSTRHRTGWMKFANKVNSNF